MAVVCSFGTALMRADERPGLGNAVLGSAGTEAALVKTIEQAKVAGDNEGTARASQRLAYIYWHAGAYNKAIPLYQRTLAIIRKIAPTNARDIAVCLNNIGLNYRALGDFEHAKQMHTEALDALRVAAKPELKVLADTYMAMSMLALSSYHYAEAEDWLNQAKSIVEKVGSEDIAWVRLMDTYSRLYIEMGKPRDAEYVQRQLWPVVEKKFATDAPERMRYLDSRGNVYFGLHRYTEAAKAWTEAIELADRLGMARSPDTISIVSHLGELYLFMGDVKNAESYLSLSLELVRQYVGPQSSQAGDVSGELGLLYTRTARLDLAKEQFSSALGVLDVPNTNRPLDLALLLTYYGEFLATDGRWEDAYKVFQRSLELREALGDHPLVVSALRLCSEASRRLKRKDEARNYAARADAIAAKLPDANLGATVDLATLKAPHSSSFTH